MRLCHTHGDGFRIGVYGNYVRESDHISKSARLVFKDSTPIPIEQPLWNRVERIVTSARCPVKTDVRWNLSDADLLDMTPMKARDLIVECFYQAQRETIGAAGRKLGQAQNDAELRDTVTGAVRLAFREATADFDQPTKPGLMAAVTILARKSQHWGTPPDIVEHHKAQIERVLQILD